MPTKHPAPPRDLAQIGYDAVQRIIRLTEGPTIPSPAIPFPTDPFAGGPVKNPDTKTANVEEMVRKAIAEGKNPGAVLLGSLGASKGGKARAKSLSKEQRKQIAKKAAKARWG